MSTVEEALETQVRNIEAKYGKPIGDWIALIGQSGLTKHGEILDLLKRQYGMTHGTANRVALLARGADSVSITKAAAVAGSDPIADLYEGKKLGLKPIHDALVAEIKQLGDDIEFAPKNGYVSLRRKKQFAMIQPATATRIDVGLILKDIPATERLEPAGGANAMFSHRVRLTSQDGVDGELLGWLRQAYERAG